MLGVRWRDCHWRRDASGLGDANVVGGGRGAIRRWPISRHADVLRARGRWSVEGSERHDAVGAAVIVLRDGGRREEIRDCEHGDTHGGVARHDTHVVSGHRYAISGKAPYQPVSPR